MYPSILFFTRRVSNLHIRSQLMSALRKYIKKEGLAQAAAAKRLVVSQPRISDLTRGKINRFSFGHDGCLAHRCRVGG